MNKLWQWGMHWICRARRGMARFRAASFWGFLLFFCWSGMSISGRVDIRMLSLFLALCASTLLAAGWDIMQEGQTKRGKAFVRYIPPAAACILIWGGLQFMAVKDYIVMAGVVL